MWWCPTCHADVPGNQVTYEEYHDKCGTYLGDVQELSDEEKIKSAIDFLKSEGYFVIDDSTKKRIIKEYNLLYNADNHINDEDSIETKRGKDILFGKLIGLETVMEILELF